MWVVIRLRQSFTGLRSDEVIPGTEGRSWSDLQREMASVARRSTVLAAAADELLPMSVPDEVARIVLLAWNATSVT